MFVVIGISHSKAGRLRYKVRDVNHRSKTDGKVGYVTAKSSFVKPVYYKTVHRKIKVINRHGVNEYRHRNLTGKVRNHKRGRILKIKGIVKYHLTTRFVLTNGHYITADKKLVIMMTKH